jgi:ABC-2 type transport system permease protein
MMTYLRFEMLRTFRNRRFLLFSLGLPLLLFVVLAGTNRHAKLDGIGFPLYFMAGMASWGAMMGVISSGARISLERQVGWTRQLRITPLKPWTYFAAKVVCGYITALMTLILIYVAGVAFGVRLSIGQWATMSGLIIIGLIPFALIGIMLGHLLKPDSMGPAAGGITSIFAVFGGAWGPIANGGAFLSFVKCVPSFWLVQSGKVAFGGRIWPAQGWIVLGAWTVVLLRLAYVAYRRDTAKVT